jgi:hypothetical protein
MYLCHAQWHILYTNLQYAPHESKFWEGLHYAVRRKVQFYTWLTDLSLEINHVDWSLNSERIDSDLKRENQFFLKRYMGIGSLHD